MQLYESELRFRQIQTERCSVPAWINCTLAPLDDIQPTELSPWIGFVYTFPEYWGHHYAGILLEYAESLACVMGKEYIYISTGHTGLYEKYGYEFFKTEKDVLGEDSRVYRKHIFADEAEKNKLCEAGGGRKAEIVKRARKNTKAISYCGLSCDHCFLGEWCGGCRSVFSCCFFGTLHEKGKCPNIVCCEEKGIGGCYECGDLDDCEKGFYQNGSDGRAAKAQALFIRKTARKSFCTPTIS